MKLDFNELNRNTILHWFFMELVGDVIGDKSLLPSKDGIYELTMQVNGVEVTHNLEGIMTKLDDHVKRCIDEKSVKVAQHAVKEAEKDVTKIVKKLFKKKFSDRFNEGIVERFDDEQLYKDILNRVDH